jgi:hypothetical protein
VLARHGKLDEALKNCRDSLAIAERRAASDCSKTGWQNYFQDSIGRIGGLSLRVNISSKFGECRSLRPRHLPRARGDMALREAPHAPMISAERTRHAQSILARTR